MSPLFKFANDLTAEHRQAMRGGQGAGTAKTYVSKGDMPGIAFVTEITLEPHASIGLHRHDHDAELYLIVAGHAEALLDDERRPVGPGDAFICPPGHSHGIDNGDEPLRFLALLTEARSGGDT